MTVTGKPPAHHWQTFTLSHFRRTPTNWIRRSTVLHWTPLCLSHYSKANTSKQRSVWSPQTVRFPLPKLSLSESRPSSMKSVRRKTQTRSFFLRLLTASSRKESMSDAIIEQWRERCFPQCRARRLNPSRATTSRKIERHRGCRNPIYTCVRDPASLYLFWQTWQTVICRSSLSPWIVSCRSCRNNRTPIAFFERLSLGWKSTENRNHRQFVRRWNAWREITQTCFHLAWRHDQLAEIRPYSCLLSILLHQRCNKAFSSHTIPRFSLSRNMLISRELSCLHTYQSYQILSA